MGHCYMWYIVAVVIVSFFSKCEGTRCSPSCPSGQVCANAEGGVNQTICVSDPCAAEIRRCNGHGVCRTSILDFGVTYRCECQPGYTGRECESFSSTNGCYRSPCRYSGVCIPIDVVDYSCSCEGTGHFGRHCEIEDQCATNPCINGVCELVSIGNTLVTSRRCRCRPGFTGINCETDINECNLSPCHNGMRCENLAGSYRCHCSPQFTGINCSIPVNNVCTPGLCLNRGVCKSTNNGPICDCPPGWSGDFCQLDVDECRTRACQNGGTCLDHSNGTSCLCLPGWSGPNCEIDINECTVPGARDLCKNNGDCINVNGSYYCVCPIGYSGRDCSQIVDMCDRKANLSCLNGGICKSEIGFYRCECPSGWQGTFCELRNPCSRNPCQHGSSCVQLFDSPENYRCICAPGFSGPNCENDVDECTMNPCDVGRCENTIGSFVCRCPPGLTGQFCSETAVFNCSVFQPCSNGGTCVSKIGGYQCLCPLGFTGVNCEDNVDECAAKPCQNSGTCIDGIGSFKCLCTTSFTGRRCETIVDMCATDRDYCYHGGRCSTSTDRLGNARVQCQCLPGFIGERCEADINECASKPCNPEGTSTCSNLVNDYACLCYPGFTGRKCETRVLDSPTAPTIPVNFSVASTKKCSSACTSRFSDGKCDIDCNTIECNFDGGDCQADFAVGACPLGCESAFANGRCDPICNVKVCLWDGNDCLLDPFDPARYVTGIKATYPMSCQAFHDGASSLLLFNISSLVGSVTREEPQSLQQNSDSPSSCQVTLMFDKTRCVKDWCPKTAEEWVNFVEQNPQEYTPGQLVVPKEPTKSGSLSTSEIVVAAVVSTGGLIISALIVACVLHGKRVRAKTWFPPGFFDVLRLSDQNTSHNPAKQRKISSSASTVSSSITQPSTSVQHPQHQGAIFQTSQGTFFDPNAMATMNANGMMLMTPPDRRELDLVDPAGPDGLTPLMLACTSSHLSNPPQRVAEIIQQLILRGANPLSKTHQREETALHLAARYRNSVALRILLDFCPDPNVRDSEGKTPLHSSVGADAQDCMRWLLRHRMIHIDARMVDGTTPLILATRLCLNALVTDLVRCNAKLDTQDGLGRTALHWAAAVDNVEAIHLLARHGADKDAQDSREQTPLFLACREGNQNSVVALLEIGCQRDLADHADVTPRRAAEEAGFREVVRLVDEFVAEAGTAGTHTFSTAIPQQPIAANAAATTSQQHFQPVPSIKVETIQQLQNAATIASAAGSSQPEKSQKLFVDLPPPYSEKPSVTPIGGADSSSQWASSSIWSAPAPSSQMSAPRSSSGATSVSPHLTVQPQQGRSGMHDNFLTPSPDNHSSPYSSTSPSQQQLVQAAGETYFALGQVTHYGNQLRQQQGSLRRVHVTTHHHQPQQQQQNLSLASSSAFSAPDPFSSYQQYPPVSAESGVYASTSGSFETSAAYFYPQQEQHQQFFQLPPTSQPSQQQSGSSSSGSDPVYF